MKQNKSTKNSIKNTIENIIESDLFIKASMICTFYAVLSLPIIIPLETYKSTAKTKEYNIHVDKIDSARLGGGKHFGDFYYITKVSGDTTAVFETWQKPELSENKNYAIEIRKHNIFGDNYAIKNIKEK